MGIHVSLNGERKALETTTTVAVLVETLGLSGKRLAVEVNGHVVPRSVHATHTLTDGDRVEIVHAIGGG